MGGGSHLLQIPGLTTRSYLACKLPHFDRPDQDIRLQGSCISIRLVLEIVLDSLVWLKVKPNRASGPTVQVNIIDIYFIPHPSRADPDW